MPNKDFNTLIIKYEVEIVYFNITCTITFWLVYDSLANTYNSEVPINRPLLGLCKISIFNETYM